MGIQEGDMAMHYSSDEDEATQLRSVGATRNDFPDNSVSQELGTILKMLQGIHEE